MPKVALYNQNGATVGEIELSDSVFGIEPNKHVLFEAVIMPVSYTHLTLPTTPSCRSRWSPYH